MRIKYIVSDVDNAYNKEILAQNDLMDRYFELCAEDPQYLAYKNPYALSIAYGVDSAVKDLELTLEYDYDSNEGIKNL